MKRHLTRLLLLVLIVTLAVPTVAFTETVPPTVVSDVIESDYNDHWANAIIQKWIDSGRISGYEKGTFKPNQQITRAEFIAIVNKGMGYIEEADITFSDVHPEDWFYKQVQIAVKAGYITGYSETLYGPNDTLTREQAAVIIARIEGLADDLSELRNFSDVDQIADWAKGKVGAVLKAGYMTGYPNGTFGPQKALSRAETVATLDRTPSGKLTDVVKPPVIPSEEPSSSGGGSSRPRYTTADMVLTNGKIYTIDNNNTVVEAVAVKDGKIINVGSVTNINKHIGQATEVIDLDGKTVLPGFLDTHLHPSGSATTELFSIDLYSALTKEDTLNTITNYIAEHPDQEIYFGSGFSMGIGEDGKGPKRQWLDDICLDKPIILRSLDGHNMWMNTKALEESKIYKDTIVLSGNLHKYTDGELDGELWGTLTDFSGEGVEIPTQTFTDEQMQEAMEFFQYKMTRWGFTGFQNAGSSELENLLELEDEGKLHSRVNWSVVVRTNGAIESEEVVVRTNSAIESLLGIKEEVESQSNLITIKTAKFFADGVVEGSTAHVLDPYTEEAGQGPNHYGDFYGESREELADFFAGFLDNGFNMHVHSVGDASTRKILDAFETAQESVGESDYRNTITHLQLVDEADIPRFAELGVIASCQVFWHLKEPDWWEPVEKTVLGEERAENEYPLKSFLDAGAVIAASSDHPVTAYNNPFMAIEVGVTRNLPSGEYYGVPEIDDINDPTWLLDADERVTVLDMVKAYTINNAYTMFREDSIGSLEKGKFADMIVIDQDIFEINPLDIDSTKVVTTIFNGEVVYEEADKVLINGKIYTVDEQNTVAEAIAIQNNKIIYVGDQAGAETYIGQDTNVIDLDGGLVLPGFVDAHMHPGMSAVAYLYEAALYEVFTPEEYLEVIETFAEENADLEAIAGAGFMRSAYDEIGPRKEWLDAIDSERPIMITSVDGHSMWVNSKALELAGITKDTPNPEGGVIQRDPGTGEPTGLLQEPPAMGLVEELQPEYTKEQYKQSLLWLQEWFNSVGITHVYDAMVPLDNPNYYEAYQELAEEGLLTIRYKGGWLLDPEMGDEIELNIEKGIELSKNFETPFWQVNTFKFFSDQVIEEKTGYMLEPYSGDDDWYGIKVWDDEVLKNAFQKIDEADFQIHTHQIGDAAAKYALDALEYVRDVNGEKDSRHMFAHVQCIRPEDIQRMADLGMTAITAPYWMAVDDYFYDLYEPYLGDRAYKMYPMKSLFDAGVNVAIHSDFFVTEPDYMWVFYSAMTRTLPQNVFDLWFEGMGLTRTTDPNVAPSAEDYIIAPLPPATERVSLEEAIKASTINGAWAYFEEDNLGSIEEGKLADLVVFENDLFELDIEEFQNQSPSITIVDGNIVFDASLAKE